MAGNSTFGMDFVYAERNEEVDNYSRLNSLKAKSNSNGSFFSFFTDAADAADAADPSDASDIDHDLDLPEDKNHLSMATPVDSLDNYHGSNKYKIEMVGSRESSQSSKVNFNRFLQLRSSISNLSNSRVLCTSSAKNSGDSSRNDIVGQFMKEIPENERETSLHSNKYFLSYETGSIRCYILPSQEKGKSPALFTADKKKVKMWDFNNHKLVREFEIIKAEDADTITALTVFMPKLLKSPLFFVGTDQAKVYVCDSENVKCCTQEEWERSPGSRSISAIEILEEDNIYMLVSSSHLKQSSVWLINPETKECKNVLKLKGSHTDLILGISAFKNTPEQVGDHGAYTIVTIGWDKWIYFWGWSAQAPYRKLKAHEKSVTCIKIHDLKVIDEQGKHTSKVMFTGSLDKTIVLWDLENWSIPDLNLEKKYNNIEDIEPRQRIKRFLGHTSKVTSLAVCDTKMVGDPPMLLSGSEDKTVIIWSILTGEIIRKLCADSEILNLAIYRSDVMNSGMIIAAVTKSEKLIVWNMDRTRRMRCVKSEPVTGIAINYIDPAVDPDKQDQVVIATIDHSSSVWNYNFNFLYGRLGYQKSDNLPSSRPASPIKISESKESEFNLNKNSVTTHNDRINELVIYIPGLSPGSIPSEYDVPLAFTCSKDAHIIAWDLNADNKVHSYVKHDNNLMTIALYDPQQCVFGTGQIDSSSDLATPMIISGGFGRNICLWKFKLDTTVVCAAKEAHREVIRSIAVYHPKVPWEDPLLVSGSYDKTAIVWNLRTKEKIYALENHHREYVFTVRIYDPIAQYDPTAQYRSLESCPSDNNRLLVALASYDKTVSIWDIDHTKRSSKTNGSASKHTIPDKPLCILSGHVDSVTAMAIYTPNLSNAQSEYPLVVTGSIDKLVIVWNLITGEKLQVLVGHEDRVCYIAIYCCPYSKSFPTVISGSDDQQTIIWEDSLYQRSFQPLRDTVKASFFADLNDLTHENKPWGLMSQLEDQYGAQIFIENSHLFYWAVSYDRSDFLIRFHSYLTKVLVFMKVTPGANSLLNLAIQRGDLVAVRAILQSWLELLNSSVDDILQQRLYHPCYYFDTMQDLELLSEKYPLEFVHFVSGIHLVKDHKSLLGFKGDTQLTAVLDRKRRSEVTGAHIRDCDLKVWPKTLAEADKTLVSWILNRRRGGKSQPIVSRMIPLRFVSQTRNDNKRQVINSTGYNSIDDEQDSSIMAFIALCIKASDQFGSNEVFQSPVCRILLHWIWDHHAGGAHWAATITYITFLFAFSVTVYSYQSWYVEKAHGSDSAAAVYALNVIVCCMFIYLLAVELRQLMSDMPDFGTMEIKKTLKALTNHFEDFWNLIDMGLLFFGFLGLILRLVYNIDTNSGRVFLSIASILIWLKLLYFLRPFTTAGYIVNSVFQVAYEIRVYLLVLCIVLAGFNQTFFLICNTSDDPLNQYSTFSGSFYYTYLHMLGQAITPEFDQCAQPGVASFLSVLSLMALNIVLLNLLIALMGDIFARIRDQSESLFYREQATIILEQDKLTQCVTCSVRGDKFPPYIHVLNYASDVLIDEDNKKAAMKTNAYAKK